MSTAEALFCRSAPWQFAAGRVVLPWAQAGVALGPEVLEIGAGGGAMADHQLRHHPEIARLTALDVDEAMVSAATARLSLFGERVTVELGDGTSLPFADASFDTVCSWLMLHHTLDWRSTLAEAHRVLRPAGLLVGYDLSDRVLGRALHGASRSQVRLVAATEVTRELAALGFDDVDVDTAVLGQFFRFRARRAS